MGQVYVLKLRGGKWYVGYTNRGIVRVLEHLRKGGIGGRFKGSKWTQAHRPESWSKAVVEITTDDQNEDDEDRKTLAYMDKYGIENVRGGKWCYEQLYPNTIMELGGLIEKSKSDEKWEPIKRRKRPTKHEIEYEKKRLKIERQEVERQKSIPILEGRGALDHSKRGRTSDAGGFYGTFRGWAKIQYLTEERIKWLQVMEESGDRLLSRLYPPDHWLHDPNEFDRELSKEFESEGFLWTQNGGAEIGGVVHPVVCAKCNRIGHFSSHCYAKTIETGTGHFGKIIDYSRKKGEGGLIDHIRKKGKEGLPRR